MRSEDRDLVYLWDMCAAASEITTFMCGISFAKFVENNLLRYAVERQLMVIGEAANRVSEGFQEKHPEIPWVKIIGQRNVLAHDYGEILADRVWLDGNNKRARTSHNIEKIGSR
ncbi:MAG: DUF86 domain-containing protein [Anaerolineaceae bacterium]|nr:DUF86 domain-containing protein [Anaerolineaceae bacterium]